MLHHSQSEETNVPILFPPGPQVCAGRTSRGVVTALAVAFLLIAAGIFIFFATREKTGSDLYGMVSDPVEREVIKGDLEALNQNGEMVRLSDLRGKVWAIAQFFAVCPICSRRNSTDLRALAKRFSKHPDFHLVCISIDPAADDVKELAAYAEAFGADSEKWWFLTGDHAEIHRYLENDLRFPPVQKRSNEAEAVAFGAFLHDLGITVVDRRMRIAGKRDFAWAGSHSASLREKWERQLYQFIESELRSSPQ